MRRQNQGIIMAYNDKNGLTLQESVVQLDCVTTKEFDKCVVPKRMVSKVLR